MEKKILIRTAARNGLLFTKTSARVWLLLAVATLATLLLLVFPEDGPSAVLFAMNFVWLLLLETLAVGAVSALRRKRFFTAQHIAVAHQAVRFAVTGLAVAVVFNVARSVLGETLELKWYGAAIALLCAWHGAKILYMLQGAGAAERKIFPRKRSWRRNARSRFSSTPRSAFPQRNFPTLPSCPTSSPRSSVPSPPRWTPFPPRPTRPLRTRSIP